MTLILTELTPAGIAMAADSAITKMHNGKIIEIDQQGMAKILRVPKIRAAISFWGMIGAVTKSPFDQWLQDIINAENYNGLESFADILAGALNDSCNGNPLQDGEEVGIHVAGYAPWEDNKIRPFFYHIHNGHGQFISEHETDKDGRIIAVHTKWVSDPRKLFEKHQDFPSLKKSLDENTKNLQTGYITRNGAFFIYAVLARKMQEALNYINLMPDVSIPRDPTNLASRKGFLHIILEMIIKLYRCSNQSKIIGGTVTSLGIAQDRYVQ